MKAWDADGHVYEWEGTFADPYWDPRFRELRPQVVDLDGRGALSWYIDDRLFPVRTGPNQKLGGTPASKDGAPSAGQRSKARDPLDSAELRNAAARLAQLDDENIEVQVNFPTMLLSWPLVHTPGLGSAIAHSYNSWIADVSSRAPDRLKWVTCIDPSEPQQAEAEIYRTKELGSVGVMVFGLAGNKHLNDAIYEPVWRACAETGLPIAVHPSFSCPALGDLYETWLEHISLAFSIPVLLAFHRIMSTGLLDRYPTVKVGLMETGCQWVPFMVERVEENSGAATRTTSGTRSGRPGYAAQLLPEEYIRRGQVFVGFEVNEPLLPAIVELYGDDCWLHASDIPHQHRMFRAGDFFLERSGLSQQTKRKLLVDNTARFYGIKVGQPVGVPA